MRSKNSAQQDRILRVFERYVNEARELGLVRLRIEDEQLLGRVITVDGRRLHNFGNCCYSGLNTDARLKRASAAAVERFGPAFSSSAAYTSVDLFTDLEERLRRVFDAPVIVPTTTTLAHLSCLPLVVDSESLVLIDVQAHSSLHLATQVLKGGGIDVLPVAHNDLPALEAAISQADARYRKIWYLADGVYSMHGDIAPMIGIQNLLDTYERLWLYIDDAHGVGWAGEHGRGVVLEQVPMHERMILAASLVKSFGAGGAALAFPNEELAARVQIAAGPMTFSGPLQPSALGAAIASCDVMLSEELTEIRAELEEQIDLVLDMGRELGLPFVAWDRTPIWFLHVGRNDDMLEVARRILADGFYINVASFPAIPMGHAGIRFTHTVANDLDQIRALLESMARHTAEVVGDRIVDLRDPEEASLDI
jgi:7-keto-8-aminopelargonate synthetase-like enzyme